MTILMRRNGKTNSQVSLTMDRFIMEGETVELIGKPDLNDNTAQFTSKRFFPTGCFWGNLNCFDYLPKTSPEYLTYGQTKHN